jgi:hypothetical protein
MGEYLVKSKLFQTASLGSFEALMWVATPAVERFQFSSV